MISNQPIQELVLSEPVLSRISSWLSVNDLNNLRLSLKLDKLNCPITDKFLNLTFPYLTEVTYLIIDELKHADLERILSYAVKHHRYEIIYHLIDAELCTHRKILSWEKFIRHIIYLPDGENFQIMKYMIDHNLDLNQVDDYTPLTRVFGRHETILIKLLINSGADINLMDLTGRQPVRMILKSIDSLKALMHEITPDWIDPQGNTVLNYMIQHYLNPDGLEIIEYLLSQASAIRHLDVKNHLGKSAWDNLLNPIDNKLSVDVIRKCIQNGIDIHRLDFQGYSLMDRALTSRLNVKTIELIYDLNKLQVKIHKIDLSKLAYDITIWIDSELERIIDRRNDISSNFPRARVLTLNHKPHRINKLASLYGIHLLNHRSELIEIDRQLRLIKSKSDKRKSTENLTRNNGAMNQLNHGEQYFRQLKDDILAMLKIFK